MATYEELSDIERLLFNDKVNEAIDNLNKIGEKEHNIHACNFFHFMCCVFAVSTPTTGNEEHVKIKELAILKLGETLAKHCMAEGCLYTQYIYVY